MGDRVHVHALVEQIQDGLDVDARRGEKRLEHRLARKLLFRLGKLLAAHRVGDRAAHQRKAVGMDARRGKSQDDVAFRDVFRVEHLGAVDHAHAKAGQVVVVRVHDAGMLCHLAADERAACLALRNAADDLLHMLCAQLADGDVIEEEERLGTAGQHVVDAHRDEVDAHRVVLVCHLGEAQLRAHAVGAAHEDRVVHLLKGSGREHPAKAADVADDLGTVG